MNSPIPPAFNRFKSSLSRRRHRLLGLFLAASCLEGYAHAQNSYNWNGLGGDNNFGTGLNWVGGSAPSTLQSFLNFAGSTRTTPNNNYSDFSGGFQIFFNSGASAFTITGNHIKFFDFGGTSPEIQNDSANLQTINFGFGVGAGSAGTAMNINPNNGDMAFGVSSGNAFSYFDDQGKPLTINGNNNGHTVTFWGSIGNGGVSTKFILAQNAVVVFNATNTYTGETDINAGELRIGATGAINSSSAIFLGNGGTLTTAAQLTLSGNGGQTFGNNFTVNNSSGGQYRIIAGANSTGTNIYSGNITLNGDANLAAQNAGGKLVFSGSISTGSGKFTSTPGPGTVILSGTTDDPGIGLNANGGTVILGKTSSSTVHAIGNTLNVNSGGAAQLGGSGGDQIFDSAGVNVNSGGSFDVNGLNETLSVLKLVGTGIGGQGSLTNSSGSASTLTCTVNIDSGSGATVGGVGNITLSGAVTNSTTATGLTKAGNNSLTLAGTTDDVSLTATVNAGTLVLGKTSSSSVHALGGGTDTVNNGGTLKLGGSGGDQIYTANAVTINSGGMLDMGGLSEGFDALNGAGVISNSAGTASILTVGEQGGGGTFSGIIVNGTTTGASNSLIKAGSGTLILSGANTYSGPTTISGGVLQVGAGGGTGSMGTGGVTNNGALVFNRNANLTVSSVITGSGSITQAGPSVITLSGANTYTGLTTIQNGAAIKISTATGLGATGAGQGTIVNSGGQLQTSGALAFAEPLTLNGTGLANDGALQVTANGANFSGPITLSSSGVRIQNSGASSTISGGITGPGFDLAIGGTVGWTVNTNPINIGSATLTKDGSSTTILRMDTANTIGAVNLNGGSINIGNAGCLGSGTLTVGSAVGTPTDSGGLLAGSGLGTLNVSNPITLNSGAICGLAPAASGTVLNLAGNIVGGGALRRTRIAGTGAGTAMLSGNNSFGGGVTHVTDSLVLNSKTALGTGTYAIGDTTFPAAQVPNISANTALTGANAIANAVTIVTNAFTWSGSSDLEFSGSVTLNTTPTITVSSSAASIFSGIISGSGFGLTKASTGILTLSGANSYTANTTVNAGILRLGAAGVIPDGAGKGNVSLTGTLDLNTFSETINGLSGAGVVDSVAGGTPTLTVGANDQTSAFNGYATNTAGSVALTKTGAGTLTLGGTNAYSGNTTISQGTLALGANGSLSNSANIIVGSGATLDVSGSSGGTYALASGQTLEGNGGVNGTIVVASGATVAPGTSPGTSPGALGTGPEILRGGGTYVWEINDAVGSAGSAWDLLTISGGIDIESTGTNPFNVQVHSLAGSSPGDAANFSSASDYVWPIATVTDSITNFAETNFSLDTSAFSNSLAGGVFSLIIDHSTNLAIQFLSNRPPVAVTDHVNRPAGVSFKVSKASLLSNDYDPEGYALTFVSVDVLSTNNAAISSDSTNVFYDPPNSDPTNDVTDAFSYVISDGFLTATGLVIVTIAPPPTNQNQTITGITTNGDGTVTIGFAGIPNYTYLVQATTNLSPAVWLTLSTNVAGTNGLWTFTDYYATNFASRFYRSAKP